MGDDWQGEERRGIPIHILNHIDERMKEAVKSMEAIVTRLLTAHETQEKTQYDELKDLVDQSINSAEVKYEETNGRLTALMQSISSLRSEERDYHANPCPQLLSAVPEGDLAGHRTAHLHMIEAAKEMRELMKHVKKTVITAAVISVGSWVVINMWVSFLKGPM